MPAPPTRVFGFRAETAWALVAAAVAIGTVVGLVYTLAIADYVHMVAPASGPDSPIYSAAAGVLYRNGLFAGDVPGIPFWPAGYPLFIAVLYRSGFTSVSAPIVVQQLALAAALCASYRLVKRELSAEAGLVTVVLLVLSPALRFSSTVFMYETLLLAAAVIACDLVSDGVRQPQGAARTVRFTAAFAIAGLGATLQPKLLAVALGLLFWAIWRTRDRMVPLLCAVSLLAGPLGIVGRNWIAGGDAVLSANLGFTMLMGANDHARGGYVRDAVVAHACHHRVPSFKPELDAEWRNCALHWMRAHPARTVGLAATKAGYFWLPFVGPLGTRGTWRHPLDHHRWLPATLLQRPLVARLDGALGVAWTALTVGLVAFGIHRAARRRTNRPGVLLLAMPVALFMAISMITVGDARFRLPVAPFYTAFMAYGLLPLIRAILPTRWARQGRTAPSRRPTPPSHRPSSPTPDR